MTRAERQKKIRKKLIVLVILAAALFTISLLAPVIMPNDPYETHVAIAKQGPSPEYPFGTDELGRCVLSRVLEGSRTTIFSTLILVASMAVVGTLIGMIAGYAGGLVDTILMRITDFCLSFPQMIIAIVVAGILGGGMLNAMLALGITGWTGFARAARGRVLAIKGEEYITAAKLSGNSGWHILFGYYMPNMTGPVLVTASMEIGVTMLSLAGLSFLGLGAQVPVAEWGAMIDEGRSMIQLAPQIVIAPAVAIFVTVTVFNLLGDTIRDYADIMNRSDDLMRRAALVRNPDAPALEGNEDLDGVSEENSMEKLLSVQDLTLRYEEKPAAKNISFEMREGEILGIVGESGSGKSTVLKAIIGAELFGIQVDSGRVLYKGENTAAMTGKRLRKLRGEDIGMIIQEPGAFYNPIRTYEKQIKRTLKDHGRSDWNKEKEALLEIFGTMHLYDGEKILKCCPCQLSGGMNQRVAIAAATLLAPTLLLADEPTSALDVTVQKKIIEELLRLNREYNMAILIVTHNIGVVREMADRVIVLKDGEMVETGTCDEVLNHPKEAYTKQLIAAVPRLAYKKAV